MVPGLVDRNGHRNHANGRSTDGWGGVRVKGSSTNEESWLHPHAVEAKNQRNAEIFDLKISNEKHDDPCDEAMEY